VYLTVSPREITLSLRPPDGSAQNVFAGTVVELVPEPPSGERIRVVLNSRPALVAEVTREAVAALSLREGSWVYAAFKATGVQRYA
jgi:molybdopterin-binding protein